MQVPPKLKAAREKFHSLTLEEKNAFIASLSLKKRKELRYEPYFWLRDKQIVPDGTWRYCFIKAGRGFGKTKMGAAWVKMLVEENPGKEGFMVIVGPTHGDVSKVMVPAIMDEFPQDQKPIYVEQKGEIRFTNGSLIYCFSSDQEVRGPNPLYVWCDELCKWNEGLPHKIQEAFDTLDFAVRKGEAKFLITTTPKPFPIFRKWQEQARDGNPLVVMVEGSMQENVNLSQQAKDALYEKFGGTRKGRQELEGEILTDNPGALWTYEMFAASRVDSYPALKRIVVAVDPAMSTNKDSDDTGIVVVGIGIDRHCYVLEDASGSYTPMEWGKKTCFLYKKWNADRIIAEKNNGGALVEANIRAVDAYVPITLVHASKGKITRAEPVAALYEQRKVHHVGLFNKLEDQCCNYTGDPKEDSPDAMDALVWGVTELLLTQQHVYRSATWVPQF